MDVHQDVDPKTGAIIIAILLCGLVATFWLSGEIEKQRASSYFLDHDSEGNLSIQVDHILITLDTDWQPYTAIDLRDFQAYDVMGNVAYFSNGDIALRQGKPESGLRSYFSLAELPPSLTISGRYGREHQFDLMQAENVRQNWVDDLSVPSSLMRCQLPQGPCQPLISDPVPWRYRLHIDEDAERLYLTEGTHHHVSVFNLSGQPAGQLPLTLKLPKRLRQHKSNHNSHSNDYYIVDTNHHQIVQFSEPDSDLSIASQTTHNVKPNQQTRNIWPLDALFFDGHWWVINASGGMTDANLYRFNKNWDNPERIILADNADPFDMAVHNDELLVSDIRLGVIHRFQKNSTIASLVKPDAVMSYYEFLETQKQKLTHIKYGVWGGVLFSFFIFFAVQMRRSPKKL